MTEDDNVTGGVCPDTGRMIGLVVCLTRDSHILIEKDSEAQQREDVRKSAKLWLCKIGYGCMVISFSFTEKFLFHRAGRSAGFSHRKRNRRDRRTYRTDGGNR